METDSTLRFCSSASEATIDRRTFRLDFGDHGSPLRAEQNEGGLELELDGETLALGVVVSHELIEETLHLEVQAGEGRAMVELEYVTERTLSVTIVPPNPASVLAFSDAYHLREGERIYGLTERPQDSPPSLGMGPPEDEAMPREVGSLDRRGESVEMYVRPTMALYTPFFHSSSGYGLHVSGTMPGEYEIGATESETLRFRFEASGREDWRIEYSLILGPDHGTIVDEYTELTGRPFLPPDWAFLHWRWRGELELGETAEVDGVEINGQLAEDLLMYEEHGIPAGVYLFDRPWAEGEYGFARLAWDEERLPNSEAMLSVLSSRGYQVALWTSTFALGDEPGDNGVEAETAGFLAPGSDRILDVTHPAAVEWWSQIHWDFAERWGIAGWKLDRGEEDIPSELLHIWADGSTGREVHNAYPNLQIQLFHDAMSERDGDFAVMARAGYAGAQRFGVFWGGDAPGSDAFGRGAGTDLGLRAAIISLQRAGFMGFPIWGSDTGGYYEFKDRDVFARWLQFSALCPIMEIGGVGSHAPWDMPTEPRFDEEMIEIYRRYVQLHHDLQPYTSRHARVAAEPGLPIARSLVFDFPDDPTVRDMWDEYLFGDDLLVAPIWRTGERAREVYLPEGEWEDFWHGEQRYTGPVTISVDAPLDTLPLFVRVGAEIPGRP